MPHLILTDASLAFGHVPLLDHADFQLEPGERVALIGRNGCGKSSLLRALAGQGALDDGTVWRQPGLRLGYVAQEPPFDPDFSVFEAVVAGMGEVSGLLAEYHAVSHAMAASEENHETLLDRLHHLQSELESRNAWSFEAQAERVIQRFSLDADSKVGTLSGGQKKRVFLARAIAQQGEVILLDEPFTGVDVKTEARIISLLRELRDEGKTMLVSTHNLGSVSEFCDYTVMVKGTVLASGPTETTFTAENLERAFSGVLRHVVLSGSEDRIITDDERPFVTHRQEVK